MNVGDLFVNLGIRGSEKTVGAIMNVNKGMVGLKTTSLEVKAAILAAMYGLGHMMDQSAKSATGILNLSANIGASTKEIQQWGNAVKAAGGSVEDAQSSMRALSNIMANIALGKGLPEGLALISAYVGGIDQRRAMTDPTYLIGKLVQFSQNKAIPANIKQDLLSSMGISGNVEGLMARGLLNPSAIASQPYFTQGQLRAQDQVNRMVSRLEIRLQKQVGDVFAKIGPDVFKDLTKLTESLANLMVALSRVAANSGAMRVLDDLTTLFSKIADILSSQTVQKMISNMIDNSQPMRLFKIGEAIFSGKSKPAHNTTVHQHFQHPGKNASQLRDATKQGVQDAWLQFSPGTTQ